MLGEQRVEWETGVWQLRVLRQEWRELWHIPS